MNYFPLFTRLKGVHCLVVGGGEVAARKIRLLLRAGARVTVNAPLLCSELEQLAAEDCIIVQSGFFEPVMIEDHRLIFAATNDNAVNKAVALAAEAADKFCNVVDNKALSSAIVPAIIDRDPVIVAVSSSGSSPALATQLRQTIEELLPPALGELANFVADWRQQVKTRISELEDRTRFWHEIIQGPVADQVLNGHRAEADALLTKMLKNSEPAAGIAYITGAGPGDKELLTLKAARALRTADVVVHDRLIAPELLELARRDAEFISVGKQAGKPSITQQEINSLLVQRVTAGERVCRLKGGDPFVFGRGGEEIEALEQLGLAWEVIPGITAANGCAASIGVPLTHRELARSVAIATGHTVNQDSANWGQLGQSADTLVAYMTVGNLADVCDALIIGGRDSGCPALLIENGTTPAQRVLRGTLSSLPERAIAEEVISPALLIVGDVTALPTVRDAAAADTSYQWSIAASDTA